MHAQPPPLPMSQPLTPSATLPTHTPPTSPTLQRAIESRGAAGTAVITPNNRWRWRETAHSSGLSMWRRATATMPMPCARPTPSTCC
eukprot:1237700-Prymnesium_polylepis.1